jgi:hypothetical protein
MWCGNEKRNNVLKKCGRHLGPPFSFDDSSSPKEYKGENVPSSVRVSVLRHLVAYE